MNALVTVCLVGFVVCSMLVLDASAGGFDSRPMSYVIKKRHVGDVREALPLLRRFMATTMPQPDKCARYAILLNRMNSDIVDQFAIAELGLANEKWVKQSFAEIDVETLRELYIEGFNKFGAGPIDKSALELLDCLDARFRAIDGKAREFLNKIAQQNIVNQYNSIVSQPVSFILDPTAVHPELANAQLHPLVRNSLIDLFNGDVSAVNSRFPGSAAATSVAQPAYANAYARAGGAPRAVVAPSASGPVTTSNTGSAPQSPAVAEQHVAPVAESEIHPEEHEYLQDLGAAIQYAYDTLPPEAKLSDMCRAYNQLIVADKSSLNEEGVGAIVDQATQDIIQHKDEPERVFQPESDTRENFLVVVDALGVENLGGPVWLDLVGCLSQWEKVDGNVKMFLDNEDTKQTLDRLMKEADATATAAAVQPQPQEAAQVPQQPQQPNPIGH